LSENKQMQLSRLLYAPIFAVIAVGLTSIGISIIVLYSAAFSQEESRLRALAQSQAKLIEAVARFDKKYSAAFRGTPSEATISQLIDSHRHYKGFGETGEFVLARRDEDQIKFILSHRHFDLDNPKPVPFGASIAEPTRRSLSGESGVDVLEDYRGVIVLAAYEPVAELNLGFVAKIDLQEIRAPFIKAGVLLVIVTIALIAGATIAFLYFSRPISNELIRRTNEATETNKAKSRFLAAMSHDLRTPLNAIMGFSQLMHTKAFGPLGDKHYEEYANDIHHSGELLIRLIDDVLDISKVEAGKFEMTEEVLDVHSLITTCVHQLEPMIDEANLEVFVHVSPEFPSIKADERVMFQLFNNLLSNAIKFTPEGGRISILAEHSNNNQVIFRIIDSGMGMTEAETERALRPFEQVDNTQSRRHKGTGLGLHLCTNFVAMMNGTLTIDSIVNKGTTVSITLPPERTLL
jgi:signal transduction histidine kinase